MEPATKSLSAISLVVENIKERFVNLCNCLFTE